ncbi:MAG: S53 family peptidase [Acidobacteriia bacterium]|nr:S53 family peptidase [Terriglobia bacterium]
MKKYSILLLALVAVASVSLAVAQTQKGTIIVPESSKTRMENLLGLSAHTNHLIYYVPGADSSTPQGERPASLGCVYGLVKNPLPGCPKNTSTSNPQGGSGLIVIIDAYDYPTAASDLATFSTTFGLPAPKFHVQFANGKPTQDCGWNEEAALDIEWAHAMAPNATIVLMEAKTNSTTDLFTAVDKANQLIVAHGGKGEVSMSWGYGSDIGGETNLDSHFMQTGVVYFASSGDAGGIAQYPSTSPFVVSVGGTKVNRDSQGNFTNETAWSGSGGGTSTLEPRPAFQDVIQNLVGTHRGTPDFSFDGDPNSGVSVFITAPGCNLQWSIFGGTSVGTPALAGVVNSTRQFKSSSQDENTLIYSNLGNAADFNDITAGSCGSKTSSAGWDFCTGVGSNKGRAGK